MQGSLGCQVDVNYQHQELADQTRRTRLKGRKQGMPESSSIKVGRQGATVVQVATACIFGGN